MTAPSSLAAATDDSQIWRPTRFTPRVGGRFDAAIRFLRVLLPSLAILIILATAIYPIFNATETSFVLARDNIEASEDRLRMINPRYSGVDQAGRPFEVSAQSAVQPRGVADAVSLSGIGARMTLEDDEAIEIKAEQGVYRTAEETLKMTAPVLLVTSTGYRIDARDTDVDLDDHLARSDQLVEAAGPLGVFRADGFESRIDEDTLVFTGNVKALLQPRKARLPLNNVASDVLDDGVTAP
ncbi:MAG: LPS export ABC transporter periplasmic protein LptC [Pseudomonadota bacterium]